ncbi:hypothetical protein FJQ98_14040 [Lysinibacillus agricola]|uniref:Uncharacterized protein n=1 Tax=Lysinibacillus agricola TaxID=2590012 RepID=A0ABX7AKR2_9BACI|nr:MULTISPECIES: hypothetical protein [Lysinibacillus]KOS64616.1 hypothetical protein AN161_00900 [Lysinibacillus sp. FJAT-14222]QQP10408.1 hypothetical protein FJQ98_14040 [Lysinibacillus agricola]
MSLEIKRRLPDGSFGEAVKPFGGETDQEKIVRLEEENANLTFALLEKDLRIENIEAVQAEILLQLLKREGSL